MANAAGRPIAPLILSSDERAYLERQVRRHRAARSTSHPTLSGVEISPLTFLLPGSANRPHNG
jgi:hypothetical protein